jgi:hypothetical protein
MKPPSERDISIKSFESGDKFFGKRLDGFVFRVDSLRADFDERSEPRLLPFRKISRRLTYALNRFVNRLFSAQNSRHLAVTDRF